MKLIYLHGFASGPESGKATFFRDRLRDECGLEIAIPDLSEGDFARLTISRQLDVIRREAEGHDRVALIGSSMGGYLAALYASLRPDQVDRLVLLAPAFWFAQRWPETLGAEAVEKWRADGWREVFHYKYGRTEKIWWELLEDGLRHPGAPEFTAPALVFHGTRDDVVPSAFSEEFAADRPNVRLLLLDSDHQLTDVVNTIWEESRPFLTQGL